MRNQHQSSTNNQLVAKVTGASQAVGFQITKALASNRYTVYMGSRNQSNREKAAGLTGLTRGN